VSHRADTWQSREVVDQLEPEPLTSRPAPDPSRKVGFVLSGGGSLGAVQAGMVIALAEQGIFPSVLAGASAGALNCAFLAAHPGLEGAELLTALWRAIRRRDVMPLRPSPLLTGLSLRSPRIIPNDRLAAFIADHVPFLDLADSPLPLAVAATDAHTGDSIVMTKGPSVAALLASSAIPGVYPPVEIDGRVLIDGSVANDQPVSAAVALGADQVYVLPTPSPDPRELPRDPLGMAIRATQLAIARRNDIELALIPDTVEVHLVPAPLSKISTFDFSKPDELIQAGRISTESWLATRVAR
jgi:NTE family protein